MTSTNKQLRSEIAGLRAREAALRAALETRTHRAVPGGSQFKGWVCDQLRPDRETGEVPDAPCTSCTRIYAALAAAAEPEVAG